MLGGVSRSAKVVVTIVGATVVIVAAIVALGRTMPHGAPATTVISRAGGFSVWAPDGWRVKAIMPKKADSTFLRAEEPGLLGRFPRNGFWVGRWWTVDPDPFYGTPAAAALVGNRQGRLRTYKKGMGPLPLVADVGVSISEYRVVVGHFVYQVGFWTSPGAEPLDREFAKVVRSFRTVAAGPWPVVVSDPPFALTAPDGWTWVNPGPKQDETVAQLVGPEPVDDWVYVFRFDRAADAELEVVKRSLAANGGYDVAPSTDAIAGRRVARLDFRFPAEDKTAEHASYDSEWFIPLPRGCLVLAVGRRSATSTVHDEIARSFEVGAAR
jgi:hypothetical protein